MLKPEDEFGCPFREVALTEAGHETAICLLVHQLTSAAKRHCIVQRSACELCSGRKSAPILSEHAVIPSLVYSACERQLESTYDPQLRRQLQRHQNWALAGISKPIRHASRERLPGCDVVLCCDKSTASLTRVIESIVNQQRVFVTLHLVADGADMDGAFAVYANEPNVILHRNESPIGVFATINKVLTSFRSSFVAIQSPLCASEPSFLASAIREIEHSSRSSTTSAIQPMTDAAGSTSQMDDPDSATFVFRRAALVEIGGFISGANAVSDFTERLASVNQNRELQSSSLETRRECGGRSAVHANSESWATTALEMRQIECDVVLPFFDEPEFVHDAVQSILSQTGAKPLIHLIDDAGKCGEAVLSRWLPNENIRCYRNDTNIGPFLSFNNVSRFFETDLAAVQDADDISMPHRLNVAGNSLRLAGSDIFGGCARVFGDETMICPNDRESAKRVSVARPAFRFSHYPYPGVSYFLENPTAVMRVDAFRQLGGFADFGERLRNRSGVDTEFYARAYYSGMRFAITTRPIIHYRYHSSSAMQSEHTGWGSKAHSEASRERTRRIELFQSGCAFDPRDFGALGRNANVTRYLPRWQ